MADDIPTLQRVLDHATLAMAQKYAHFSPGHLAEVVNLNPQAHLNARLSRIESFSEIRNFIRTEPAGKPSDVRLQ